MNMKIVIEALATCMTAMTLVFTVGSANAGANNWTTGKTVGKPNIVHIVADDLGWKDVGFNGATDIKTPNLDKLAAEGVKFTQFYVQPMCTPTRAALMTGRYPFRYGLQTAVIPSVSPYGLDTSEWLMPQCLKEAGYNTAIIGKWHLGHADKKYWPKQRGFDYQYGAMIGELDYFTHEEHGVLDWYRDNKPVREEGYTTQLLGNDEAGGFRERWLSIQVTFVDEPRQAVEEADSLVDELMQRLAQTFSQERENLESQWSRGDDVSTEDLRVGLQRYRSFFERLLAT